MKRARTTQSLPKHLAAQKQTTTLHHQMEDPCQGKALLESYETMQSMHDGEALHHHQTGTGNTKQMKLADFYMPAPTKVHS